MKISRTLIWFAICLLFTLQIARSLGGSEPNFEKSTLLVGESSKFFFTLYNYQSDKQYCTYSITGLDPLTTTFEADKITVDEHSNAKVYGTVSVPSNADTKSYSGNLLVTCASAVELKISGSVVKQTFNIPFTLSVVGQINEGERSTTNIPQQEKLKTSPIILVLIIVVLILAIIGFYLTTNKKTE